MKILLIRLREIGDVVFTTPAIRAIRARFPEAHLSYLVEPLAAPILAGNPHLSDLIIAPRPGGLAQAAVDLRLARRLRAARFDLTIDFHGGPRAARLTWAAGSARRIGYDIGRHGWIYTTRVPRPRDLRPRHSVINQWDLLTPLGIGSPDPAAYPLEMAASPAHAATIDRRLGAAAVAAEQPVIVIHVSAGNPFRRWPPAHFAALIAQLVAADPQRRIVLTAGPSDREAASRILADAGQHLPPERREALVRCGEFDLGELRALVARAALYIGGDSGPLHIAATTRTPIVALFGPTLAERSAPWRDPALITEIVDAGPLPCRPCEQRHCAPGDFRCLTGVAPEQVAAAAERALARARR